VRVRLTVANTGPVTGKEVVQLYVGDPDCSVDRPVRELKAFTKIELAPGRSAPVDFTLHAADLSFYSPAHGGWVLEGGDFELAVGASSRDLRLTGVVTVHAPALAGKLSLESTVAQWLAHPVGGPLLVETLQGAQGSSVAADPAILRMVESLPLDRLVAMSGGALDRDALVGLLEQMDA
jgi:beta-glucosidase